MNIAIRADASASLGLGHLKRCLSLALALRDLGASVSFFQRGIDDVAGAALVAAHGFRSHTLGTGAVGNEADDARAFIDTCTSTATTPNLVLVDHYALGAAWHTQVRRHTAARLAAIDDLGDRPMAVDLLIDPNVAADHAAKHAATLPPHATVLGGPKFALLGPAYATAQRCEPHDTVRSIGIFMGGTDEAKLSELALTVLRNHVGFTGPVEIATTSGNPNLARLRRAADASGATRITLDQPDLAAFFARHDLHLGAGGGATWERCCIGAPTLAMIAAPNQREVLLPLQFLGVVCVVTADPPTHRDIADALRPLLINPARRRALAIHARALVDGLGASRVAGHLLTP